MALSHRSAEGVDDTPLYPKALGGAILIGSLLNLARDGSDFRLLDALATLAETFDGRRIDRENPALIAEVAAFILRDYCPPAKYVGR